MNKTKISLTAAAMAVLLSGCDGGKSVDSLSCENPQIISQATESLTKDLFNNLPEKQRGFFKGFDDFVQQNHIRFTYQPDGKPQSTFPGEFNNPDVKGCVFSWTASPVLTKGKKVSDEFTATIGKKPEDKSQLYIVAIPHQMNVANSAEGEPTQEQTAFDEFMFGEERRQAAQQQAERAAKVKAVKDIPLNRYSYATAEQLQLAYIAHNPQMTDDEKMSLLSEKYRQTNDPFTKQDLLKSELPRLLSEAEKYKDIQYIKYVESYLTDRPADVPDDAVFVKSYTKSGFYYPEKYDFDKKLFTVESGMGCEKNDRAAWRGFNLTNANGNYSVVVPKDNVLLSCTSIPADENQAREWSKVFSAGSFRMFQVLYVALDNWTPQKENGVVRNNVQGLLAHVEYHIIDNQTSKDVVTGQIN